MHFARVGRPVALALAVAVMLAVTFYPRLLVDGQGHVPHGTVVLVLWGMAAGFVYGIGYVPERREFRWLLGPWVALPLMAWGCVLVAARALG